MRITIPDTVLSTELDDEGVLLNLETGEYFALDDVGLDFWKALAAHGEVAAARGALLARYDVAEDVLARDLDTLIATLAKRKLVVVTDG